MGKKKKQQKSGDNIIARNKKASFSYHLEERIEAGLVLCGWEVKSLRAGKAQINEAHVIIKKAEAWLIAAEISPLAEASKHTKPKSDRSRKLLLNRKELDKLVGAVEKQGYTIVPTFMYWKKNRVKIEIALAKGKKLHDKRQAIKEREWSLDKARLMKIKNR